MTNDLVTIPDSDIEIVVEPTVGDVALRVAKVKEFMQEVMVAGINGDYSVIPGCGSKPVLLKPGAEKLARLFNLSVAQMDRTMFEIVEEGYFVAYQVALAAPDGRVIGVAEAFASAGEKTFQGRNQPTGHALLNSLTARAQKRAFVRAVLIATGASDLFGTDEPLTAPVSEAQRDVVLAIYETVMPKNVERAKKQASKISSNQWEAFLGAAVDVAQAVNGWDDSQRDHVFAVLNNEKATPELATELCTVGEVAA